MAKKYVWNVDGLCKYKVSQIGALWMTPINNEQYAVKGDLPKDETTWSLFNGTKEECQAFIDELTKED